MERAETLDPTDWVGFRVQAHRMLDDMIDYTETVKERPLWEPMPDDVRGRLGSGLPWDGSVLEAVHGEFKRDVLPYALGNVHPGFMGWVHGGGTPVGMLAAMLAAGMNANAGGRDHAPVEVEWQLTRWMRELFDFPEDASGICVSGTSMANLMAVIVARKAAAGRNGLVCYGCAGTHGSIGKALEAVGLGVGSLRTVATDKRGRIDLAALEAAIAHDEADGLTPWMVVGTAGTVDTGAINDLDGIAGICEREGLWFHVDGAFGALAMLAPGLAPKLKGIERADSLAFDFHKWGQVPYEAGYLLVRDGKRHREAFSSAAPYLKREARGMAAGTVWPCDLGIEMSRGFGALKVWFTFKVYGARALGEVVARTCELAQYLAERVSEIPELELLAEVELNVVCFRYRNGIADELLDGVNRQIVVDLQECGSVAPSTTVVGGCVAIRAAIVNHRTTRAEVDTLVEQTLVFGRALKSVTAAAQESEDLAPSPTVFGAQQDMFQLALEAVERRLESNPSSAETRFQRACLQEHMGKLDAASEGYRELLEINPEHMGALNNLGNLLLAEGRAMEAKPLYVRAAAADPTNLASKANLGNLLIKEGETAAACEQFRAALEIDPEYRAAHAGLSLGLDELGDPVGAAMHRRRAFADRAVMIAAYRGDRHPITVLELLSVTGGNIRTDTFLSDRVFQRIMVSTEFYKKGTVLPPHDLVINAIGEADAAVAALDGARLVLGDTSAPVINKPEAVLATGRVEIARRLRGIPGVRTPRTELMTKDRVAGCGFGYPLLLRTPGFHGGENFVRVNEAAELEARLAELPGDEVLAIEYLDATGADGNSRKYRVMMVDGEIYPLHVAVSRRWKIHYFSADMMDSAENRAEDRAFLENMEGVLGTKAMTALRAIVANLGLEYGGIDFGLNAAGEVLVFEANATMVIAQPDKDPRWDYRREPVEKIYQAVWEMLRMRAEVRRAA